MMLRDTERLSYSQQVVKIYNSYEELVFNLADQSNNETTESIKRMTLGQRMKFQQLLNNRNKAINKQNVRKEL